MEHNKQSDAWYNVLKFLLSEYSFWCPVKTHKRTLKLVRNKKFYNWDFGSNWDKVLPHLQTKEFSCLISIIYDYYKRDGMLMNVNYNNICPSSDLTRKDSCYTLKSEYFDMVKANRNLYPNIGQELWDELDSLDPDSDDYDDDEEISEKIISMTGFDNLNKLHNWMPFGECHTWNKTFGYWLAQKIFPNKKWQVVSTDYHTTVVSLENNLMFDILAWGWSYRDKYVLKQPLPDDPTFGADESIQIMFPKNDL